MVAGESGPVDAPRILHASCVALHGQGVLITGKSGSGKSTLALELMARGAMLVADDRTCLTASADGLIATCPPALAGRIEARGIGILAADCAPAARVRLVVDLDVTETDRLPPRHQTRLAGIALPLLRRVNGPHFPAAILQYLKGGRCA
ncbi:HPr kinase/phosphorylase [Actibacterium ureilyticum]|uniref:HPr kinase/phosphorylase n=1 Tax=Actibacterium ureilyticum TaxID=1590614 RepID=UPI000BAAFA82|nr:HPr kinase/phosphatase C-terminal domain-containing protein [Actibacterium ureilyticum]